jgi:hypothetical protein
MNQLYLDTARLMVQVAPFVFADGLFALKGGTAINLFLRDLPRLSVDLDLVFPNYKLPRVEALAQIKEGLHSAAERLKARGFETYTSTSAEAGETKLSVRRDRIEAKIEVNFVLRGTVHSVRKASLTSKAREILLADLEVPLVSLEDVYGGKLVAALDRQHPRDLFDVMQLFAHEGITPGIRRAFVVYLASHNRPLHEILSPVQKDIRQDYERTFKGMTAEPVTIEELLAARDRLIRELQKELNANERRFLVSLVNNRPEWDTLEFEHIAELPGIRWKLQNLQQLAKTNPRKFKQQAAALERLLA